MCWASLVFVILLSARVSSEGGELVSVYETSEARVSVFRTKITVVDSLGNPTDSYSVEPLEIKDSCSDREKNNVFVILGSKGTARGERLALFSLARGRIEKIWIDDDRGHHPWKIIAEDIDGDSQLEICVGVWKKARFHPVVENRLFVYGWDGKQIFPKWLGSRLSSPFVDFDFQDADDDGLPELLALEVQRNGLKRIMCYEWNGFGFEGTDVVRENLKEERIGRLTFNRAGGGK